MTDCRTWDPKVLSYTPSEGKKKISQSSNHINTTTNPSVPELNTWNCLRSRTWVPEVPRSCPIVVIIKSLNSLFKTIAPPIPLHQSYITEIVKGENLKSLRNRGRKQDLTYRYLQSKSHSGQKENLAHVQSEHHHHQSLCTRVKYLKLLEVKTRSHCGIVFDCRTWDP